MKIAFVTIVFVGLMILGGMALRSSIQTFDHAARAQEASLAEALR
jgi:hypothetical protein